MIFKLWLQAFRPKTLSASVIPVMVATALVYGLGFAVQWMYTVLALLSTLCIQIATNLINDSIDFKKGADTEKRIGPQRLTQGGHASPQLVMLVGISFLVLALLFGVPLVLAGGKPILLIGIISLFLGYAYTGGPFPLAYMGLGDLFVILFFGIVAVAGVFYIHAKIVIEPVLVAGIQVGLICAVLIVINNFRDMNQDRLVNKKTLAVRFGSLFSRLEILVLYAMSFLLGVYWYSKGFIWVALLPILSLPLVISVISGVIKNPPGPVYNKYLAQASLVHMIFGAGLAIGFML